MKLWYLAHPIAKDAYYTVEENLAHIVKVQKILFETGIRTVAPYYSYIVAYGGEHGFKYLEGMLAMDCECVRSIGRIMLVGHRFSSGMQTEHDAAFSAGLTVVNLIGVPDKKLVQVYTEKYLEIPIPF